MKKGDEWVSRLLGSLKTSGLVRRARAELSLNDARQLLDKFVEFIRVGLNQETRGYLAEHSRLHLQARSGHRTLITPPLSNSTFSGAFNTLVREMATTAAVDGKL